MNDSTVNFTTPETSTNSTTQSFELIEVLNVCLPSIHFLFALPTHSYVIWLIITRSSIAMGFFNLNLSVCEIGNCLISLINIFNHWIGFSHLTTLRDFLIGITITGRHLFQCLMCVERYLAVVQPVTFLKFKPLRYRLIFCTAAWIITLGSCFCCMFTIRLFFVYVWLFSLQFVLFLSIQLFFLVAVLRALKQSGPGERRGERKEENNVKRRAFYFILITTVSMIIFYVPFIISGFSFILTHKYMFELFYFSCICYALAGFVHPVLYLHHVRKLCCCYSQ